MRETVLVVGLILFGRAMRGTCMSELPDPFTAAKNMLAAHPGGKAITIKELMYASGCSRSQAERALMHCGAKRVAHGKYMLRGRAVR